MKIIGNLPYYISTPIIGYLLEEQRERIKDIFITVQREVGKRLVAERGNKDYSALTILVRYFTKPRLLFSLSKRSFYPQPKVDSVFVHLHLLKQPAVQVNNQRQFFKIVKEMRERIHKIDEIIKLVKKKLEHSSSHMVLLVEGVKKLVEVAKDYSERKKKGD